MNVSLSGAMYALSFACGLIYLGLGLAAYDNVGTENTNDKLGAAGPWWAFYSDVYNEMGRRFWGWGKLSFVVAMLLVAAGYLVEQTVV